MCFNILPERFSFSVRQAPEKQLWGQGTPGVVRQTGPSSTEDCHVKAFEKLKREYEKGTEKKKEAFLKFQRQLLGGLKKKGDRSNSVRTTEEKNFLSEYNIPLDMSFPRAASDKAASRGHRCGLRDQTTSQLVEAMNGANKHGAVNIRAKDAYGILTASYEVHGTRFMKCEKKLEKTLKRGLLIPKAASKHWTNLLEYAEKQQCKLTTMQDKESGTATVRYKRKGKFVTAQVRLRPLPADPECWKDPEHEVTRVLIMMSGMRWGSVHCTNAIYAARPCRSGRQTQRAVAVELSKSGLALISLTRHSNGITHQLLVFGKKTRLHGGNCRWKRQGNTSQLTPLP